MNKRIPSPLRLRTALLLAATVGLALPAHAGILRDVFAKVGIGGSSKPPVTANGETPVFPRQGYLCCNLRHDGDEISDSNYATLPDVLKAGTPVTVTGYGRDRANINIDGKEMQLEHEYGRKEEGLDAWVHKMVVDVDPRPRISGAPATVQAAIRAGKVVTGMTKQQALLAVGHPPTNLTKSTDEPVWTLWASRRAEYHLHFGADGRLTTVTGDGDVTKEVIYLPPR